MALTVARRYEMVGPTREEGLLLVQYRQSAALAIDGLLARLPADDPQRRVLQARARAYSRACGCAMGGAFLTAALVLTLVYFATVGSLGPVPVATGGVFVLLASGLGKAAGLLLAWVRLALLRRSLRRRLDPTGLKHVHVH